MADAEELEDQRRRENARRQAETASKKAEMEEQARQDAEATRLDLAPRHVDCVDYDNDRDALLAEEKMGEAVPEGGVYRDEVFQGLDAVYVDFSRPPHGALPADLIQWLRIGAKEVAGMDRPTLFPMDRRVDAEGDGGNGDGALEAAKEEKDDGENPEEVAGGESEQEEALPERLDDVEQGQLGNRWFLNALAPLLNRPSLVRSLFVSKRYARKGLYTVKIYKDGRWRYLHIDDSVPCDMTGIPLFSRCKNRNAAWIMLLEKVRPLRSTAALTPYPASLTLLLSPATCNMPPATCHATRRNTQTHRPTPCSCRPTRSCTGATRSSPRASSKRP